MVRLANFRMSYATYLRLGLGLSFVGAASQQAFADAAWVGDTSSDWNTAANWSTDPANPTGNFTINNSAGPGVFPVISANSAFTPVDIFVGTGGATGRLDQTAGTAGTGNGNWLFVGIQGANGTFNLANTAGTGGTYTGFAQGSGSFNAGGATQNGQVLVGLDAATTAKVNVNTSGTLAASTVALGSNGSNGTNTFNIDNGTVTVSGEFQVGGNTFNQGNGSTNVLNMSGGSITANIVNFSRGNNAANTMDGTATLTGGTLASRQYFTMGYAGATGAESSVTNNGGTINVKTDTTGTGILELGVFDATTNTFTVNSGSVNLLNNSSIVFGSGGNHTGASTFTQNGGTVTLYSDGGTTVGGTGSMNMGSGGSSGTYTYNLNGGTLTVPKVQKTGGGNATFNFNGGTLKAAAASDAFMGGLTQAFVNTNGAIVDSNGFDITIGQDLADGGGGLTKNGAGTLTLAGADTFTGASTVNTGTLAFAAKQSSIGSLSVAGGAGLRVQAFDTTTTPVLPTALTLASGSALTFDFNSLNYSASTPLATTGVLTASGTVGVTILNAANLPTGTHKLIGYSSFAGGGSFTGAPFTLGTRSSGTLTNASGALSLNVTSNSPKWTGLDNGNWVVGSTGANKNWKLITGGTATDYIQGDVVLFDDSVTTGTTSINISAANVTPATTTFSNSSKDYTLSSTGGFGIAGTGPLTKSGTGALVITNANTYTGLTTIESGATLTLGNGTTGNDGTIAGTSGVANEGTLAFNRFGSATSNYLISGTGSVTMSGPGTQILTAANTYSGGTTVNAGTLQITTTAGDANTGNFTLGGGKFQVNLGTGTNFTYTPTINLTAASTIGNAAVGSVANLDGQICLTGTVNGNNNVLNIENTGLARFYLNGTLNDVSQINVVSGAMGFDINVAANRGTAPVDIASGAALWFFGNNANPIVNNLTFHGGDGIGTKGALFYEGGTPAPAAFTGTVNLASGTTSTGTAYAADTITLDGVVSGTGGFNILSGGLALGGANTYSGGTTVTLGRAIAKTSTAFGTGAISTAAVAGVQVRLDAGVNVANALTLAGSSFIGEGELYVPTGDATYSGPITITADTTPGGHFASGAGSLTLTGAITSSVPVKVRNGTVAFTNPASSYSGLIVQQGTAKLGANNVIPTASTVDLGASGAATLDLGGFNQSLAGLTKNANGATVTNSGANDATLTTTGTITFNGVIQNGATHKTALTVGGGALTLGGANTFTGNVTVNTGLTLADNAQLRFTPGANTLTNSIGGAGTLTLDGDFVIDLAGASIANGNSWTLVNVGSLTETFSATFSVVDFTESANVWTKVDGANTWTFSEATGVLSLSVGGSGYSSWATANAGGQAENLDYDNDGVKNGVEFFFGATGSTFTPNPALVSGTVTWPKSASFTGTYKVWTSTDLVNWTDVTASAVDNGTSVSYTPVTGSGKRFVRLEAIPN